MSEIASHIAAVREEIARAAQHANRDPATVRLVAVSKTHPVEYLLEAYEAGQRDFGENYQQELLEKIEAFERAGATEVRWHFIGHLQRRKVRDLMGNLALVHAVESESLAREIDKRAAAADVRQDVLVQVNVGGEESKFGAEDEDQTRALIRSCEALPNLRVCGLMTMPPYERDPEAARGYFRALREMRDRFNEEGLSEAPLTELSMGLSHDYPAAIAEGATLVRVGTAIFGPRDYSRRTNEND